MTAFLDNNYVIIIITYCLKAVIIILSKKALWFLFFIPYGYYYTTKTLPQYFVIFNQETYFQMSKLTKVLLTLIHELITVKYFHIKL